MANPDIVDVATINAESLGFTLGNSADAVLMTVKDDVVLKVNSIIAANDDGTNSADITVTYNNAASGGGTAFHLAKTVAVAADSTLVVLDKASSIYLEENTSLVATASAGGDLDVVVSYEEIID